jgi:hypothetical protein
MWNVRVLSLGVLDGIARFSSLSGYLVSNEDKCLRKCVKLDGSAIGHYVFIEATKK